MRDFDFSQLLTLRETDFSLILKKELKDIMRDKRSFVMLFIPVLIFPLMCIFMGSQLDKDKLTKNIPCIVECGPSAADEALYETLFEKTELVDRREIKKSDCEDLKSGAVYAVIRVEDGQITILYNDSSTKSLQVGQALITAMETVRQRAMNETLQKEHDLSMEMLQPFALAGKTLSEETGESGNSLLASLAPMMLVMVIMSGSVSVAVDLFTGEKERGTFESLMTTQVSRISILLAKFTATLCISLTGMVLSILAFMVSFSVSKSARNVITGGAGADAGIGLSASQLLGMLAVCLLLSVFAVSLMTLIGLHAKTVKEAQSQMSLITILPTLVSGLTMFMESADIPKAVMCIPVFNAILSIKMTFLGTAEPFHIVITVLSSLI